MRGLARDLTRRKARSGDVLMLERQSLHDSSNLSLS
jgi:hypothetical protein